MKIYTHTINYTGLNGQPKVKEASFTANRIAILGVAEANGINGSTTMEDVLADILNTQDVYKFLTIVKDIIIASYVEVDYETDYFDNTVETKERFEKSLPFFTLLEEIATDQTVMEEILGKIVDTIDMSEEEKAEADSAQERLRAKFIEKTTIQNDDKSGKTAEILELEAKLKEMKGE